MDSFLAQKIDLVEHSKGISALDLDANGSRLASATLNGELCLWDFGGMDAGRKRPFKKIDCFESSAGITSLKYSANGDFILIGSGSSNYPKCSVYSRDGALIAETSIGDRYLVDLRRTKGHVNPISSVAWHPFQKGSAITCSADSTIRIWDLKDDGVLSQRQVIVLKSGPRQQRSAVTCCTVNGNGKLIAAGLLDGSIKFYSYHGPYSRPTHSIGPAHQADSATTCVSFSLLRPDTFVTRSVDDTCKLWDLRKLSDGPVAVADNLPCVAAGTSAVFAGDREEFVVTGSCSVPKAAAGSVEASGNLVFLNASTLKSEDVVALGSPLSVNTVVWHHRIKQLAVGTSDGTVSVYYDEKKSQKGALLCSTRQISRGRMLDELISKEIAPQPVLLGNAAYALKRKSVKSTEAREREAGAKVSVAPGRGGAIGVSPLHHFMKDYVAKVAVDLVRDPREAILEHAAAAEADPIWVAPAYGENIAGRANSYESDDSLSEVVEDDYAEMARLRLQKKRRQQQ